MASTCSNNSVREDLPEVYMYQRFARMELDQTPQACEAFGNMSLAPISSFESCPFFRSMIRFKWISRKL